MSFEWACVGVVNRAKIADELEKLPNGLRVDDLANLVQLEKGKLARIIRLLATKGCFAEGKTFHLLVSYISYLAFTFSCAKYFCKQPSVTRNTFKF